MPLPRMTRREFEQVVDQALAELPPALARHLHNVAIEILDWPDEEDLASVEDGPIDDPRDLLGLFVGTPLTEQEYGVAEPNLVKLFRKPLQAFCRDRDDLARQIRKTVLHELAHHFGFAEKDLADFEDGDDGVRGRGAPD